MAVTALTVITEAYLELGVVQPGDTLSPSLAQQGLSRLTRLLDNWNALPEASYSTSFLEFTLVPNLNPHTIGPTGVWDVDQRPTTILGATIIENNVNPPVNAPTITLHDAQWYQALTTPTLAEQYPTDGYYDPAWTAAAPNGLLYLYPVPNYAWPVQLMVRTTLAQYGLTSDFSLPPGYRDAVTLTLAEMLSPLYPGTLSEETKRGAQLGRARIFGLNVPTPMLITQDTGMPRAGSDLSSWDYRTGTGV